MFWTIFGAITGLKLLLMPAYFSTDFEVHRNWLALTHSLPLSKWYYEATSIWTLDYPPLFAYFEWMLSQIAFFFDPAMLDVENLDYASPMTVIFQRLSVIVTDVVYALGVKACLDAMNLEKSKKLIGAGLLLGNIGLLMVDHVHFQYNGLLFGIMLLSIARILQEKYLQAAFYFAYLLHMKHIYIYIAPVYGIYLFKVYCLGKRGNFFLNLTKLGLVVVSVTAISLGPFVNHIPQLVARLFPFKRGLSHAYWAPNFWAVYNFIDKFAAILMKRKGDVAAGTGGLVKTYEHQILPQISPLMTFLITFLAMLPIIVKLFFVKNASPRIFIKAVTLCACTSFLFGWHVHEKAILLVLIPLSLLSVVEKFDARMSLFLGTVGYYSLFPLLFKTNLIFIKIGLFGAYTALTVIAFQGIFNKKCLLRHHEVLYLMGLLGLFVYENFFHYLLKFNLVFPFLPLMLTSVYCAVGVLYFWLIYYVDFLRLSSSEIKVKTK
ncbi:probable dolichyl pyrophosphate Glc1Man9GlcNAc2 alpha-1,3-glucosyltransferase [Culicoides brevitarsis]|uniref:probable dolichyl pyrophosphate Glc1Man9GlcNAc2 alpha-1,3-glucosyltransferase n=1 Tax=Culicoides brevitarsis TaxID=469753 RepID=UPI00307C8F14